MSTVYDSLHSLLDNERLLFHCDEWRTENNGSHIELSYELITTKKHPGFPNIGHHLKRLLSYYVLSIATGICVYRTVAYHMDFCFQLSGGVNRSVA
jgi:hypothetical protein